MNENPERSHSDVLDLLLTVTGLLSFVLGFVLGICVTKKISKCRSKKDSKDFDADEYIRSLNLD